MEIVVKYNTGFLVMVGGEGFYFEDFYTQLKEIFVFVDGYLIELANLCRNKE
jgi:hypothetical protein